MKEILLTQNHVVIIDNDDYEKIKKYKWRLHRAMSNLKYAIATINNKPILMHRFLLGLDPKLHTDHINGNSLDNRKKNLRICTHAENMRNRKKSKNNTSGFKGVWWAKDKKRWKAEIYKNGKKIHLGSYKDILGAARAYNKGALKYHGEFARLNEIPLE
jgi:hypothetical protein